MSNFYAKRVTIATFRGSKVFSHCIFDVLRSFTANDDVLSMDGYAALIHCGETRCLHCPSGAECRLCLSERIASSARCAHLPVSNAHMSRRSHQGSSASGRWIQCRERLPAGRIRTSAECGVSVSCAAKVIVSAE